MKLSKMIAVAVASAALSAGVAMQPVNAATNPYQRGPAPTNSNIEATKGYYATSSKNISALSAGGKFGGGTIWYPTSTADGKFGVVAVSPGFTASEGTIDWLGPRIASQGFVVVTIDTNTRLDQPAGRGDQLLAALDHAINDTTVKSRIDSSRQAVIGHSMGGGGTLEAAKKRPGIKATIGLTPWNLDKTWPEVTAASMIIGAQFDVIAPVATHSIPFYNSLTKAKRKAYIELRAAGHLAPNISNTTIARYSIAWLKRYVDDDTRYEPFLAKLSTGLSDYRMTK